MNEHIQTILENEIKKYRDDFDTYFNPEGVECSDKFKSDLLDAFEEKMNEYLENESDIDPDYFSELSKHAGEYALERATELENR